MKAIPVINHHPRGDNFNVASYPGPGAYLLPDGGIALVDGNIVLSVVYGAQPLLKDVAEPAADGAKGGSGLAVVDVHRLIDQIAAIANPAASS